MTMVSETILYTIFLVLSLGGWVMYFRTFKIKVRKPFSISIRLRDDGTFHISGENGTGTSVEINIPINENQKDSQ